MTMINVGCGTTPINGWCNYDNSFSVRISQHVVFAKLLSILGFINKQQMDFIDFAHNNNIIWADGTKSIPLPDGSAEVLYSSHMIEHLDRNEAKVFLFEARRVLVPGGIIRIVAPDINKLVYEYINNGDADALIDSAHLTGKTNKSLISKLSCLIIGNRHHQWMYDGASLVKLLSSAGFKNCTILEAGSTTISNYGELNLRERESESVYVEAIR